MPDVLDRRLIFVTGKGGVGRSTVAAALGLLAARRGRRTIIAELAGQQRIMPAFARSAGIFEEVELSEGLFAISIDPQEAMDEYFRVNTGTLGQALGSSRVFQAFAMATPGMREMLSVGKVWELAQPDRRTEGAEPYDLVVVDAPATGHGVGLLRTPATFAGIARVGPIAHQAGRIAETIADRSFTGIAAVCLPEEMPVNETLTLERALGEIGLDLDLVVLNQLYPKRFGRRDIPRLREALEGAQSAATRAALRAALSQEHRAAAQRTQRARLARELGAPIVELPYVFAEDLGVDALERLSRVLEQVLPERQVGSA